jgi:hypothetical protein
VRFERVQWMVLDRLGHIGMCLASSD